MGRMWVTYKEKNQRFYKKNIAQYWISHQTREFLQKTRMDQHDTY